MALIDSKASFEHRAVSLGLTPAQVATLQGRNVDTFGSLFFLIPTAGAGPDETKFEEALVDIYGSLPNLVSMGIFRRLYFEAQSMALEEAKQRLGRAEAEDMVPRKLPAPERAARFTAQQLRITGLVLDAVSEPSHALCDLCQAMYEENLYRHIDLSKCTNRAQELHSTKVESSAVTDKNGFLKLTDKKEELHAEVNSDYRIRQAFTRRALAMDQANLITFVVGEAWTNHLFRALTDVYPDGCGSVSMNQILACDQEMSVKLTELCRTGIQPSQVGVRPLDVHIQALTFSPKLVSMLLPRAQPSSSSSRAHHADKPSTGVWKNWKQQQKALREAGHLPPKGKGKGKSPGKGKGKGKSKGKTSSMPPGLEGCWQTVNGSNVCYRFNLGTCEEVDVGQTCSKGLHLCCTPRCGGSHSRVSCPKK